MTSFLPSLSPQMFKHHHKDDSQSSRSHGSHSQFKVVSNKRQSVISNAGNPAGWINRTTEKEEEAVQGEDWRSDA